MTSEPLFTMPAIKGQHFYGDALYFTHRGYRCSGTFAGELDDTGRFSVSVYWLLTANGDHRDVDPEDLKKKDRKVYDTALFEAFTQNKPYPAEFCNVVQRMFDVVIDAHEQWEAA